MLGALVFFYSLSFFIDTPDWRGSRGEAFDYIITQIFDSSTKRREGLLFGFTQLPSSADAAIVDSRNRHTFTRNFTFFREARVSLRGFRHAAALRTKRTRDAHPRFTNALGGPRGFVVYAAVLYSSMLLR